MRGESTRPNGTKDLKYAQGLGNATNNQAQDLVLLKGIKQLQRKDILHAQVIGDSQSLISLMVASSVPK